MAIVNQHPAFASAGQAPSIREIPVTDSSFLTMFKYDQSSFMLTVVFKNGAEYVHQSIFPMTVDQLMESPNKGKFYATQIKGKTPSARLVDKAVGPRGGYHGKSSSGRPKASGAHRSRKGRSKPTGSNPSY